MKSIDNIVLGTRFGRWTFMGRLRQRNGETQGTFRCACGTVKRVTLRTVLRGQSRSCGCLKRDVAARMCTARGVNLVGRRFGRWKVLKKYSARVYKDGRQLVRWVCRCRCGSRAALTTPVLLRGISKSCGCLKIDLTRERSITHGLTRGGVWQAKYVLWHGARVRSRKYGVPFDLTVEDIPDTPRVCPVLGIPLRIGRGKIHHGSPTLDRIRPERGYVRSNIRVISHRANALKRDATYAEMQMILADLRRINRSP